MMNKCPTREAVQLILESTENDSDFQELLAHVQVCRNCQELWKEFDQLESGDHPKVRSSTEVDLPTDVRRRLKLSNYAISARSGRKSEDKSSRLEVRCPNCRSPLEVAIDTLLTDLTCQSCGSHFSLVDSSPTPKAGTLSRIGRFELIARVGVGSFGSVWKAHDSELDRDVAIKIPRHGAMTADEQEKFFREARAAAQLRHPNIVTVYEVGRDGEHVYIVSDFVQGITLSDWLVDQRLTGREAAQLCSMIAEALEHAHAQGVVHRDLKPANILIDSEGEPHLTDFGLARREIGEVTMTLEGQVLGTPAYMSPEQAQGDAHTADRRTDVYSLGVILFQVLTGELPFRGNARMIMHQVIHDEPPSPRHLNSNLAKDLETITLKCIEKSPSRRYDSAQEVADELRRYLAGDPIVARPISWLERRWRWCLNHRAAAGLLLAIPLLAVTIAAISIVAVMRIDEEQQKTTAGLYQSLVREARALRSARSPGYRSRAWSLLSQAAKLDTPLVNKVELRQEAVSCMGDFVSMDPEVVGNFRADITCIARGKQKDTIYVGLENGTVIRVNVHTKEKKTIGRTGHPVNLLAVGGDDTAVACATNEGGVIHWSRNASDEWRQQDERSFDHSVMCLAFDVDNRCIVVCGDHETKVELFDLVDEQPRHTLPLSERPFAVALTSDTALLSVGDAKGELTFWDAATGQSRGRSRPDIGPIHRIEFAANSKSVACAGGDGFAFVDVDTGQRLAHNKESSCKNVALSPNGRLCALSDPQGRIRIWNVVSNAEFARLALDGTNPSLEFSVGNTMGFSASGGVFYLADERRVRIWDLWNLPEMTTIEAHDGGIPGVSFSPDGKWLASVGKDGRCVVTSLEDGETSYSIEGQVAMPFQSVDFHPSGQWIATGGWGGGVEVWDLKKRQLLARPRKTGNIWRVSFSEDGKKLGAAGEGGVWLWNLVAEHKVGSAEASLKVQEVANLEMPGVYFYCTFAPKTNEFTWCSHCVTQYDEISHVPREVPQAKVAPEVSPLGFLPNGTRVLLVSLEGNLQLHDIKADSVIRDVLQAEPPDFRVSGVDVSQSGQWAAVKWKRVGLSLINIDQPKMNFDLPSSPTNSGVWFWQWSPDGKRLALACADGKIYVWNIAKVSEQLSSIGVAE